MCFVFHLFIRKSNDLAIFVYVVHCVVGGDVRFAIVQTMVHNVFMSLLCMFTTNEEREREKVVANTVA